MVFLTDELWETIHGRAARYDADNSFPYEDLNDLREAGYLAAFVPTEFGGAGLTLEEIAAEQTRLAKAAPGTALGINMHQIIVGLGRHLVRHGNPRGELILREAAAGEKNFLEGGWSLDARDIATQTLIAAGKHFLGVAQDYNISVPSLKITAGNVNDYYPER